MRASVTTAMTWRRKSVSSCGAHSRALIPAAAHFPRLDQRQADIEAMLQQEHSERHVDKFRAAMRLEMLRESSR
jgi:hypothetical protein